MQPLLNTAIEYLKGVGPQRADILKKELNIFTYDDLLLHFPFRYIDRTKFYTVADINQNSQYIQLRGKISYPQVIGDKRTKRMTATFTDEKGSIELVWFKGLKWIEKAIKPGAEYIVFGKPNYYRGIYNIPHPELEQVSNNSLTLKKSLQPVYSTSEKMKARGLDSKGVEKLTQALLEALSPADLSENLPQEIIEKYKLTSRYNAFFNIHFPSSEDALASAQRRLKFEELFFIQIKLLNLKIDRNKNIKGFLFPELGHFFHTFYDKYLQFELTNAQKRVLKEIRKDTLEGKQMNRLLQGDVGSGKTIVALMTMLMACDNVFQACIMAPTEILAQQHYNSINDLLKDLDINISILTGSVKGKERKAVLEKLESGVLNIVVGTHALIEEHVIFKNLGMVVIDEQHRFGVAQRASLWKKNVIPPHVLIMSATPIPRTLAMTLYGDLDVSVIDELPPGRKPITTVHKTDHDRLRVFGFIKEEIAKGRQVYVVYPLIQESETLDYKDLMDGYESIVRAFPMPDYHVSIIHGQMKADAKEYEMQRFVKGETQIMVATTVIEVGVNVPNASVMIIESAERFGLSQLHQLRGRVGRGAEQSFCILMTGEKLSNDARKRIKTMCATNDGFKIAEVDMQLRGPGDIEGTQQSGILNLRIADLTTDMAVLQEARKAASRILEEDPSLSNEKNQRLKLFLQQQKRGKLSWSRIS